MGREIEASVSLGSTLRHQSGVEISVASRSRIKYETPGETSRHEAAHGVIDPSNVKRISRVPGPGYLGITEVYHPDTVMAAAAHADGHSGTGHDMMLVDLFGSPADLDLAKSTLASRGEEKHALASAVEAHGTLGNGEVQEVMQEVKYGKPVTVTQRHPNGERKQREERINWKANTVRVLVLEPEGVAELPKATSPEH